MTNIEEKRKKILDYLEKKIPFKEIEKLQNYTGPVFLRKIKKLIFAPRVYIPILLYAKLPFFLFKKIKGKTSFFQKRNLTLLLNDPGPASIIFLNYIPLLDDVKLTKFFIKNFKENDIFYDIGANYGYYTYLALEFCKEVHSFEPLSEIFYYLKLNLENEKRSFLNNVALSNENGEVTIHKSKYGLGGSTIITDVYKNNRNAFFGEEEKVKTITLDDYIKNHTPPTIIKIDVEGAENLVLEGGRNLLKDYSPIIAMEVWQNSENHKKAIELLKNFNYQSYEIDFNGEISLIGDEILEKGGNFVFIKK